jgi:hypothetical protein
LKKAETLVLSVDGKRSKLINIKNMAKYYIIKYEKKRQSFLDEINSLDERGNIQVPYTVVLEKHTWFGLVKKIVRETICLPKGVDASKHFVKGREYVKSSK